MTETPYVHVRTADEDLFLRVAKSRGLDAKPGPTPKDDELRRAVEAFESVITDALLIVQLVAPQSEEFIARAFNLREYARDLVRRMP